MPTLLGLKMRLGNALRFGRHGHRTVFSEIFKNRYWGDEESVSGIGSRMAQTENIRRELPRIIAEYDVKRLFDAPCGDLNWIKSVLTKTEIEYEGADIVPEVVEMARRNSPSSEYQFTVFDITSDSFPSADMWLCRDVLFHLSYANIWRALENFCQSDVRMMLVTTHTEDAVINRDIWTGDFRLLDLFKPPFSIPSSIVLDRFADYADPMPARDMVLLRREDLAEHIKRRPAS
jgi:hypothetical protein